MGSLSVTHLVLVFAIVMLLFGKGKFSALMEDFGKGIKSLKSIGKDDA
jgi:sec-independent protein translocase protein TatA